MLELYILKNELFQYLIIISHNYLNNTFEDNTINKIRGIGNWI